MVRVQGVCPAQWGQCREMSSQLNFKALNAYKSHREKPLFNVDVSGNGVWEARNPVPFTSILPQQVPRG